MGDDDITDEDIASIVDTSESLVSFSDATLGPAVETMSEQPAWHSRAMLVSVSA